MASCEASKNLKFPVLSQERSCDLLQLSLLISRNRKSSGKQRNEEFQATSWELLNTSRAEMYSQNLTKNVAALLSQFGLTLNANLSKDTDESDLFRKCFQERTVREWEKQDREGKEAKLQYDFSLTSKASLGYKSLFRVCTSLRCRCIPHFCQHWLKDRSGKGNWER